MSNIGSYKNSRTKLLALAVLWGWGCARSGGGAFDAHGYVHHDYDYHVVGPVDALLGADWQLDNYYQSTPGPGNSWTQKDAEEYVADYELDANGDGKRDSTYRTYLYDLRWKHRRHDSVIWLRTFPISKELKDRDLRVLMQDYVIDIAGAGYERVHLPASSITVLEKRIAAAQLDAGTARVAGLEAFVSTVDVVNVDQDRITPGHNRRRVRLALIRTPFEIKPLWAGGTVPILMIAGYANFPADFEADLPSFERLLKNIEVHRVRGFEGLKLEPLQPASSAVADSRPGATAPNTSGTPAAVDSRDGI